MRAASQQDTAILWRRIDHPGHEYARLSQGGSSWLLAGVALFGHEGLSCRLDYSVTCDLSWSTTSAHVSGWVGERKVEVSIAADDDRSWKLNGNSCAEVAGCMDVDLNFSPSTNLLPIRRLHLAAGESAHVRAAWLRFPGFTLEPLEQNYTRISERTWRYESADGKFVAGLRVNEAGLPTAYGNIWTAEAD